MMKSSCCESKKINVTSSVKMNGVSSFLTTMLIILLPKCPLCIGAYAGAALLFFDVEGSELAPYFVHIRPFLGAVILMLILMNNKGRKTLIAGVFSGIALILLLISTYLKIEILPSWILYVVFILSIWFNGNFEYFFRYVRHKTQSFSHLYR